jgi:hypothetical protein
MMSVSSDYLGGGPAVGGAVMKGNVRNLILFSPNFRDKSSSDPNSKATRETDTIYARGFKERATLISNSPASWRWRRIVFACKGLNQLLGAGATGLETSNGYVRLVPDYASASATTSRNNLEAILFRGNSLTDWINQITAKVDTQRVTLLSDKTRTLNSGNALGKYFKHSQWYPINKNIVYSNDENGEVENSSSVSTTAKPGMGDVFIADYFECSTNQATDTLFFEPECTFYWHEK